MAEVYSSDSITVLGGPARINLDVDFGPVGQRGSQIFVGNGNPNSISVGQTPKIFDMYINLDSSEGEYRSLYQYQNSLGTNTWVKLINLIPNIKSINSTALFVAGEASINIPVASIAPSGYSGSITAEMFNIQYSVINNSSPIISNLVVSDIVTSAGVQVLPLTVSAKEFSGGGFTDIDGQRTVHLFISVV